VEPFEEEALRFDLYTPKTDYDKTVVYQTAQEHLLKNSALSSPADWEGLDSKSILKRNSDPVVLNDFYAAALLAYPELKKEAKEAWLLSGFGPTFFRLL
jgi:4-diphosphocytidyl-2-C-methyl-D-erythritol kinase